MHKFYLRRNNKSNDPKESTDYDSTMARLHTVIVGVIQEAASARLKTTDEDEVTHGLIDRKKPEYGTNFSKSVDRLKKETKDVMSRRGSRFKDRLRKEDRDALSKSERLNFTSSESKESHYPYLRIPFSWYREVRREYHGNNVPYADAIQVLSFIVYAYRTTGVIRNTLLHLPDKRVKDLFGLSKDRTYKTLRYLEKEELAERVLFEGLSPWYAEDDATSGKFRFVIPNPSRIREITYDLHPRFEKVEGGTG